MKFQEILQRLIDRDPEVTECFFFWKGLTIEQLEELRRKDPSKAARQKKPICNTCRPMLLRTLSRLYEGKPFNYEDKVSDLYLYLITDGKLEKIDDPSCLMGWLQVVAYNFFLSEKKKEDMHLLENDAFVALNDVKDIEDEDQQREIRQLISDVMASLPNETDVNILDKALDILQYTKGKKIAKRKEVAEQLGISVDAYNTAFSRAKKQFKKIAEKM